AEDHATIEKVTYRAGVWNRDPGPGDGDVPPWSSQGIDDAEKPPFIPGEHLGMIHTGAFRGLFNTHVAPLHAPAPAPQVHLQPVKSQVRPGSVAAFSVIREGAIAGRGAQLAWTRVSDRGARQGAAVLTQQVALSGT